MLGEIIQRLDENRGFEAQYPELQSIANKIITNIKDFEGLLIMVRKTITRVGT